MDRKLFFDAIRNERLFRRMSPDQVSGTETILDAGDGLPLSWLAYALATAYGETGGRMVPITENMNYTSAKRIEQVFSATRRKGVAGVDLVRNPEKLANTVYADILGNGGPETGDGWRYRGHGLVQLTGKDNFRRMGELVGVDLVRFPKRALEPEIAAQALLVGIRDGIYTGKAARDYLPADGPASLSQFIEARRIINGTFEAIKYAAYADDFQEALVIGRYAAEPAEPVAPVQRPTGFAALVSRLFSFLGKGGPA